MCQILKFDVIILFLFCYKWYPSEKTVRSSKSCTFCTDFRALNASDPNNYANETWDDVVVSRNLHTLKLRDKYLFISDPSQWKSHRWNAIHQLCFIRKTWKCLP